MVLSSSSVPAAVGVKIRNLIDVHSHMNTVQQRDDLIRAVLKDQDTPSLDATRTVAIRDSNQIDDIREEVKNPSFESGEDDIFTDKRKPSKFTENYNVSDKYVDTSEDNFNIPELTDTNQMQIITVTIGQTVIAKIVIPFIDPSNPA